TASLDWIGSGRARGRKALVIASDIASYGLNTAGEPTQGAGAVAIVVSENPRLVALDTGRIGDYTRQVMDFWRPLYSKYAFADGHYSIECYLDALSGARADAIGDQAQVLDQLSACLYHVPFVKMAFKAHQRQLEIEQGGVIKRDDVGSWQTLTESYQRLVAPWLELNAEIGNIYTGSLFLALIDLLRQAAQPLAGREISLFSYGSGCGATFSVGMIEQHAHQWVAALDPADHLATRRHLAIPEYEAMIRANETADHAERLDPANYALEGGLYYLGTRDHRRIYSASG
ncbi:MAG: hypothetical protein LC637_05800, partial [Xanthomonadaceae bacterium]|nr:hypothetical protein [Xanthomonadaceae bacterium]